MSDQHNLHLNELMVRRLNILLRVKPPHPKTQYIKKLRDALMEQQLLNPIHNLAYQAALRFMKEENE